MTDLYGVGMGTVLASFQLVNKSAVLGSGTGKVRTIPAYFIALLVVHLASKLNCLNWNKFIPELKVYSGQINYLREVGWWYYHQCLLPSWVPVKLWNLNFQIVWFNETFNYHQPNHPTKYPLQHPHTEELLKMLSCVMFWSCKKYKIKTIK